MRCEKRDADNKDYFLPKNDTLFKEKKILIAYEKENIYFL